MNALRHRCLAIYGANPDSVWWAATILEWDGYEIERVDSGAEALERALRRNYDLILLGYDNSRNSLETLLMLTQTPETRRPILLFPRTPGRLANLPQTHLVPMAYLNPGFTAEELLEIVKKLEEFKV